MKAIRVFRAGSIAVVFFLLSGCLPIPVLPFGDTEQSRQNITDGVPDFIVVGKTTRADVLLLLGDPDRKKDNDRNFLYFRETEEGGVAFVVGGAGRGAIVGTPVTFRVLIVGFDAAGVVDDVNARKVTIRDIFGALADNYESLWHKLSQNR